MKVMEVTNTVGLPSQHGRRKLEGPTTNETSSADIARERDITEISENFMSVRGFMAPGLDRHGSGEKGTE